jgi:YHS domain-containing protein
MEKCGLEAASAVFPIMAVPERKGSRNCLTFRMDMTNSPHARHGASGHTDPVCGAQVGEDTPWKAGYQGKTYFFCSRSCRDKFTAAPEEALAHPPDAGHGMDMPMHHHEDMDHSSAMESAAAAPGTVYTCPMHPQIRQNHPGACPICGMTLEPLLPSANARDDTELNDFRRRFYFSLPFVVLIFIISMGGHLARWMNAGVQTVPGHPRGPVGGRAAPGPGMGFHQDPQSQYVDADRRRNLHRLSVQPGRYHRARLVSRRFYP